jgi:hypothetical protein
MKKKYNKLEMLFLRAKSKVNQVINPAHHEWAKEQFDIECDRMHRRGEISYYKDDKGVERVKFHLNKVLQRHMKEGWVRLIPKEDTKVMFEINDESLAYIDVLAEKAGYDKLKEVYALLSDRMYESESPWGIELLVDQETDSFKVFADRERSKFL